MKRNIRQDQISVKNHKDKSSLRNQKIENEIRINKKRRNWRKGLRAEQLATFYLRCKFYRILAHRLQTPLGEIDIVAKKGKIIALVEVKYRGAYAESYLSRFHNADSLNGISEKMNSLNSDNYQSINRYPLKLKLTKMERVKYLLSRINLLNIRRFELSPFSEAQKLQNFPMSERQRMRLQRAARFIAPRFNFEPEWRYDLVIIRPWRMPYHHISAWFEHDHRQ